MGDEPLLPPPPHICVIGAGLIGLSTAYHLSSKAGPAVRITIVDSAPGPALATSFANAGRFVPTLLRGDYAPALSLSFPGNAPTMGSSPPLTSLASFSARYLRATFNRTSINQAFTNLAALSIATTRDMLAALPSPPPLTPHNLWVFSTPGGHNKARHQVSFSPATASMLSAAECLRQHPALALPESLDSGCALVREDFSLDARHFALSLAEELARQPHVTFLYGTRVTGLSSSPGGAVSLRTDSTAAPLPPFDHVVVCAGPQTPSLVPSLSIMPVLGCTLDLPQARHGPALAVADYSSSNHFQATPMADSTLRLTGWALPVAPDALPRPPPDCAAKLIAQAKALFPALAFHAPAPEPWCGLRPVSPDLLPYVGRVASSLWVNAGHGPAGWTLCAATGRLLAQALFASQPGLEHLVDMDRRQLDALLHSLSPAR